jgi:hypothetical protein
VTAIIRELRKALGWDASIRYERDTYHLDQTEGIAWIYDIDLLRQEGRTPRAFATGIEVEWAERTRRKLGIVRGDAFEFE